MTIVFFISPVTANLCDFQSDHGWAYEEKENSVGTSRSSENKYAGDV